MRPDDLLDRFAIDPTAAKYPPPPPDEPVLTSRLAPPGFADAARLDPTRATAEAETLRSAPRPPLLPFGLAGSLGIHLLPLLALLDWSTSPAAIARPIPLQLVFEQPPPTPPPPPRSQIPKTPGRLASIDIGDPGSPSTPKSTLPPELASALATPVPPPEPPIASPQPTPDADRRARQAVAAGLLPNLRATRPAPHPGRVPGPAATRDEYLAYCMGLIRRSSAMLPASFIGGRSGRTVLTLVVLDDGLIAHIAVRQSSGYPDIDSRIAQMVAAVRRFPPLPQWIQARSIRLEYIQIFPDRLLGR